MENDAVKVVEAPTLIGGYVAEEILLRNEFLAAENEILRCEARRACRLDQGGTDSSREARK